MKKLFLISAVSAGLFTSCVQNEQIVPEQKVSDPAIKFQTVVAKQGTRAIITGTEYGASAPSFGSYGFINPDNLLPGSQGYIRNAEIVYRPANGATAAYWGTPEGQTPYKWPKEGSVTFYAYSPYYCQETDHADQPLNPTAPEIGSHGFIFSNYDVDAHQQTDLMVADIKYGLTANQTNDIYVGVPTIFKHKLAMIGGFILTTSQDYDGLWDGENNSSAKKGDMRFKIRKIELKNIPTIGTFTSEGINGTNGDIIPEKWTDPTVAQVKKNYVWYNNADGVEFGHVDSKKLHIYLTTTETKYHKNPTIANGYLLVKPQQFLSGSDASLEITYTIGTFNGVSWDLTGDVITKEILLKDIHAGTADLGWGINKKLVYTLDFSTTEIRWAPSVLEWDAEDIKVDY